MKYRFAIMILATLAITSLRAGEIQDLYNKDKGDKQILNDYQEKLEFHGVTEIGIERTPCFGACPVYTLVFNSDGIVRYHGQSDVARKGDWTGTVNKWRLAQLATVIVELEYAKLADEYNAPITDNPTVFTTVVIDGKRKTISNYANAGPAKLWAIEQLIDKMVDEVEWNPQPTTKPAK